MQTATIINTPELQTIVTAAAEISKKAGLNYIGTESLLYAIVVNPQLAACKVINDHCNCMNTLKATIYKRMVLNLRKTEDRTTALPFTPAVEGLLALAGFERNEADSIGLVTAMLKAENTAAARILYKFNFTYPSFYQLTSKI
jgi:ATP-dependent Clp protease ATP-binding subunit ClpA